MRERELPAHCDVSPYVTTFGINTLSQVPASFSSASNCTQATARSYHHKVNKYSQASENLHNTLKMLLMNFKLLVVVVLSIFALSAEGIRHRGSFGSRQGGPPPRRNPFGYPK